MKTIIVPIDFSESSKNAARFAVQCLIGYYDARLLLYHSYSKSAHATASQEGLDRMKKELSELGPLKIEWLAEEGDDFVDDLERLVRHQDAHLIIMGVSEKSRLEQFFLGAHALELARRKVCPVLAIPPECRYRPIKNVVLASDFKNVASSIPVVPIISVLEIFRPKLHIINVDASHYVALTDDYLKAREKMQDMFVSFNPEFYFIGMNDFHDALTEFTRDKEIDMIITIPRKHSLSEQMFRTSNTKKLIFESHLPVLAAHE